MHPNECSSMISSPQKVTNNCCAHVHLNSAPYTNVIITMGVGGSSSKKVDCSTLSNDNGKQLAAISRLKHAISAVPPTNQTRRHIVPNIQTYCSRHSFVVNFNNFQIIRAIGRGSFSKVTYMRICTRKYVRPHTYNPYQLHTAQVCIVQKRDSGRRFAMKYVSRTACSRPDALSGVLKEVDLLSSLEHPFLVNLWYTFQGAFVERGIDTVYIEYSIL